MPAAPDLLSPSSRKAFRSRLLKWFDGYKRDLPWRSTRDPYAIWVSEIMLQQTRVEAVLGHYRRFLVRFPGIQALARARLASVLALWSGLGYYRRARAMHAAARLVVREHQGQFPSDIHALLALPGIGRYTAAAIASIAFAARHAVVDGNVERVLERLRGRQAKRAEEDWQVANSLLDPARPGDFNQALMELGATVCLPRGPHCAECPVRRWCATRGELPVQKPRSRTNRKHLTYLLAQSDGSLWLTQRHRTSSLMPEMWELPVLDQGQPAGSREVVARLRHSITNTEYRVTVARGRAPGDPSGRWVKVSRLGQFPLTGLTRKILRKALILGE